MIGQGFDPTFKRPTKEHHSLEEMRIDDRTGKAKAISGTIDHHSTPFVRGEHTSLRSFAPRCLG